jgi:hypothetical protein
MSEIPESQVIENRLFVSGQMDAQGHAAEKFGVGRGGPILAMSKRLLAEGRADLCRLTDRVQELEADVQRLTEALQTALALLPEIEASLSNDALADMNFFEVWAALRTAGEGQ